MPKKPPAPMGPKPRRLSPEELARNAVDRLEPAPGGRVGVTFRLTLSRQAAEALSAEAIRREINIPPVVEEILEAAKPKLKKRAV
jgi:hypothetical protein